MRYQRSEYRSLESMNKLKIELRYDFLLKVYNISIIQLRDRYQRGLMFSRGSPYGPLCPLVLLYLTVKLLP